MNNANAVSLAGGFDHTALPEQDSSAVALGEHAVNFGLLGFHEIEFPHSEPVTYLGRSTGDFDSGPVAG